MLYYYNKNELKYKKLGSLLFITIILLGSGAIISGFVLSTRTKPTYISERHIYTTNDTLVLSDFNKPAFVAYMKDLNIKFPHIVYAQAVVETGRFKSNIFLENNNLFGMKRARIRCNLARGTQRGHAYYEHWSESVIDYALYQNAYLYNIDTEEQYFAYLSKHYAEDPNYVSKLKKCISEHDIKSFIDKY